jgi:hypothetical protein
MAKVKELHVGVSYTYQPAAYHAAKGEAAVTLEIEDGEDFKEVASKVRDEIMQILVMNLAGVGEVHEDIYKKGLDPVDLLEGADDDDFEDFFTVDD